MVCWKLLCCFAVSCVLVGDAQGVVQTAAPLDVGQNTHVGQDSSSKSGAPGDTPSVQNGIAKSPSGSAEAGHGPDDTQISNDDLAKWTKVNAALKKALDLEDNQDFSLVLGIGSQVVGFDVTDYQDESHVLRSSSLGHSTPQLLAGVAFRTPVPNFPRFNGCRKEKSKVKDCLGSPPWRRNPWSAFVSLKFAPGASETFNGFVIGGSWAFGHYVSALIGFSLAPINEPSPGFRTTAAQFVTNQQKLGLYQNFDPAAMLANQRNAFDGFPVTDPSGKLIFQGNPLGIHYRGGAVFGLSVPILFKSVFSGGGTKQEPASSTTDTPGTSLRLSR